MKKYVNEYTFIIFINIVFYLLIYPPVNTETEPQFISGEGMGYDKKLDKLFVYPLNQNWYNKDRIDTVHNPTFKDWKEKILSISQYELSDEEISFIRETILKDNHLVWSQSVEGDQYRQKKHFTRGLVVTSVFTLIVVFYCRKKD